MADHLLSGSTGPDTIVGSGDGWTLLARIEADGSTVTSLVSDGDTSSGASILGMDAPGSGTHLTWSAHRFGPNLLRLYGITSDAVASIQVLSRAGDAIEAEMFAAADFPSIRFYILELARGFPADLIQALGPSGEGLETIDLGLPADLWLDS